MEIGSKNKMFKNIILNLIKFYQKAFSPDHGIFRRAHRGCRFYPSCSKYAFRAVEKYGAVQGLWLGAKRVARCHPWNEGGIDKLN